MSFASTYSRFDKEDVSALALPLEVEPVLPLELTRAVIAGSFETLRLRAIGGVSDRLPLPVFCAIQKVGFGFWTDDDLHKALRNIIELR